MTRRIVALLLVAGVLTSVAWFVYVMSGVSATESVRRHFGVDASTTETIRAGLLLKVPVGMSEAAIVDFLDTCGIGRDSKSSVWQEKDRVDCRIESDERAMGFPHHAESHIRIHFELDASRRLRDIRVDRSVLRL